MDQNTESVPETGGDHHPSPTTHVASAQYKPRYGSWMLVTRKPKPTTENSFSRPSGRDNTANHGSFPRHNRKDDNVVQTQGNNPRNTRKEKNVSANQNINPHHARKDKNVTVNQDNQFGVLTDLNEHDEQPTDTFVTDKNGAKSGSRSATKGKAPTSRSTPPNAGRPPQSSTGTAPHEATPSSNLGSRGRGGRTGANRGRGRDRCVGCFSVWGQSTSD
nr:hypothetical protein Itr_chr03CG11500 [Ipomoea trifida]